MNQRRIPSLFLALLISAAPALAEWDPAKKPYPPLDADARAHGIAVSEIEVAGTDERPRIGDSVTLLVTLSTPGREQQWLAQLTRDALTLREVSVRPSIADAVRFTTTGNELHYRVQADAALRLVFLGPYSSHSEAPVPEATPESERVLVNSEFLGFGLDQTCRIWVRLQDNLRKLRAAGQLPGDVLLPLETSVRAFPDSVVKATRATAARIGFTTGDERPFYGMEFALESFLQLVESSHGASEISDKVVERPPWWVRFTGLGVEPKITAEPAAIRVTDSNEWGVATTVYRLPIDVSLNGGLALHGSMAVTAPKPPLRVCAGILGFTASPLHSPRTFLTVTVIAARRGSQPLPDFP